MNPLELLQAADLHWDQAANVLRVSVQFPQGVVSVVVPMSTVALEFVRASEEERASSLGAVDILGDLEILGSVYDLETVGGLWGSIKKIGKKAFKAVKKTVKKVRRVAKSVAHTAVKAGKVAWKGTKAVVRSKYAGGALLAVSAVCPAVGAPAMAAWMAAKQADRALTAGGDAAKRVASGVRQLSRGKPSVFRSLGVAALQSVGGSSSYQSRGLARLPSRSVARSPARQRLPPWGSGSSSDLSLWGRR